MKKTTRNTFIGGIDQDSSNSKRKEATIYSGLNIKVLTSEGQSSGAIRSSRFN